MSIVVACIEITYVEVIHIYRYNMEITHSDIHIFPRKKRIYTVELSYSDKKYTGLELQYSP